jgi:hypothetical protein
MTALAHPPRVIVRVGPPVALDGVDAVADTATLMAAIVDLLPEEARAETTLSRADLDRTRPSA